jgi:hypothetical protein
LQSFFVSKVALLPHPELSLPVLIERLVFGASGALLAQLILARLLLISP